jgi:hypothetical protein
MTILSLQKGSVIEEKMRRRLEDPIRCVTPFASAWMRRRRRAPHLFSVLDLPSEKDIDNRRAIMYSRGDLGCLIWGVWDGSKMGDG